MLSIPDRLLLASSDLNARARVLEAAGDREVITTSATGYHGHLDGVSILVLDLDEGGSAALAELRELSAQPPVVIGFMSHVDRELGRLAREAGCRPIARGRFWSHLTEVLGGS